MIDLATLGGDGRPFVFDASRIAAALTAKRAVVLAPHPDDFDAIAVTLHALHEQGVELHLAVLTGGASGVDDAYPGADTPEHKRAIREREQLESCRRFGLPAERVSFLRLDEVLRSENFAHDARCDEVRRYLLDRRPELVFMPHGHDTNLTHQRTWALFSTVAQESGLRTWACLNRDAKTVSMRVDMLTPFGAEAAAWKADLLRAHDSQQQRNMRLRGAGFDERVLELNRLVAREQAGLEAPWAEAFEWVPFGQAG